MSGLRLEEQKLKDASSSRQKNRCFRSLIGLDEYGCEMYKNFSRTCKACKILLNMQICDLLVTVVDVVSLRSLLSVLKLHGIAFDHV